MADERHIAAGSRLIVVAEQQHEQSGLTGLLNAMGLDGARNQGLALFGVVIVSWLLMRLARRVSDRHTIAKSPPPPARVGHSVATSVSKAPRLGKDKAGIKTARYAEPGRAFTPAVTGRCSWKQLSPPAEDRAAQWFCTRCGASCETAGRGTPSLCLRDS